MQIIAVNNNYIRILYNNREEFYSLGELVKLTDARPFSIIGQILSIQSVKENTIYFSADIRLLFNLDRTNKLSQWTGKIPAANSIIEKVKFSDLKSTSSNDEIINLGNLTSYSNEKINLNFNEIRGNTIILGDRAEDKINLNKNLFTQIGQLGKKQLLLDFNGSYEDLPNAAKITAGIDFKLPLNYETMEFLYDKALKDASAESKAVIQDVFFEVQNYTKSVADKFIPFAAFKNVVDAEYTRSRFTELVLLKNKLLKYNQANIFASNKAEFNSIALAFASNNSVILDLSKIPQNWHKEFIEVALSFISAETVLYSSIEDPVFDEKLIKKIVKNKYVLPIFSTNYESRLNKLLKSIASNMILFLPNTQQRDYPCYASFLSKLSASEFIAYGKFTYFIPVFVNFKFSAAQKELKPEQQPQTVMAASQQTAKAAAQRVQGGFVTPVAVSTKTDEEFIVPTPVVPTIQPAQPPLAETMQQETVDAAPIQEETMQAVQAEAEDYSNQEYNEYVEPVMQTIPEAEEELQEDIPVYEEQETAEEDQEIIPNIIEEEPVVEPQAYEQEAQTDNVQQEASADQPFELLNQEEHIQSDIQEDKEVPEVTEIQEIAQSEQEDDDFDDLIADYGIEEEAQVVQEPQEKEPENINEGEDLEYDENFDFDFSSDDLDEINNLQAQAPQPVQQETPLENPQMPVQEEIAEPQNQEEQITQEISQEVQSLFTVKPKEETQKIPIYPVNDQTALSEGDENKFKEGDVVSHPKYGKGTIKKIIGYGNKKLCSIQFDNIGRRLLDPTLADIELVNAF